MSTRTSGFDAISRMVAAGLGVAVVPHSVATSYAEALGVKVLTLNEQWAERRLMISVRSIDSLTPAAAAFLAHLTTD
jgi:DNA-binding transcriptional LysR family regulator